MAKYQAREWTQADSDAFNKKRAEQLGSIDIENKSIVSSLGFQIAMNNEKIKDCEKYRDTVGKEKLLNLNDSLYEIKKYFSDRIQAIMEKKNSEKVEQAPEVSRTATA